MAFVLSRVIFWSGVCALAVILFGDVLDDERMKWAMTLPAAYLIGILALGD